MTRFRLLPPETCCPQHPEAGPGVTGTVRVEFMRGSVSGEGLRCRDCGFAFMTREQSRVIEEEAQRLGLL